jgi:hypothetical protein
MALKLRALVCVVQDTKTGRFQFYGLDMLVEVVHEIHERMRAAMRKGMEKAAEETERPN